jgi:hypothetical protein
MNRRVLVAMDLDSPAKFSISYGIRLSARTKSSLTIIAVSSSKLRRTSSTSSLRISDCSNDQRTWLNEAIDEGQKRDINVEVFVTSGEFFDQLLQFIRSQPIIQFIVLNETNLPGEDAYKFGEGLRHLRQEFEGEILLVRKAGDVTHFFDLYGSARGIRV